MSETRDAWADIVKGVGIVLVVYGHVARGLYAAGLFPHDGMYRALDNAIYLFHMPLFFFISGYFLGKGAKKGVGHFWADKIDKLLIPYVLWSLIQGGIEVGMSSYTSQQVTLGEVLNIAAPRGQMWFLLMLFGMFSACLPLLFDRSRHHWGWWLFFAASVGLYSFDFQDGYPGKFFPFFLYFMLGTLAWHYEAFLRVLVVGQGKVFIWSMMAVIVLAMAASMEGFDYEDRGFLTCLCGVLAIVGLIGWSRSVSGRIANILTRLGANSFDLFILHIIFGSGARIILDRFIGVQNFWIHLLAGMAFGVCAPIVVAPAMRRFGLGFLFGAPIFSTIVDRRKNLT